MRRVLHGFFIALSLTLTFSLTSSSLPFGQSSKLSANLCSLFNGIVEENKLNIPVGAKGASVITEEVFERIMDEIEAIYSPIVTAKNGNLVFEKDWGTGTVNAYAVPNGEDRIVHIFGGIARHPAMTPDGLALVICHELGHHIGGMPKTPQSSWGASNEGQSDYFAALKCMRKYMEKDNNQQLVRSLRIPSSVSEQCSQGFTNPEEIAICKRTAMAGAAVSNLFAAIRNTNVKPDFTTPDPTVVTETFNSHPAPQCRLDTYFAAAVCPVNDSVDFSDSDPNQGTCTRANGFEIGLRPTCWYKPSEIEQ